MLSVPGGGTTGQSPARTWSCPCLYVCVFWTWMVCLLVLKLVLTVLDKRPNLGSHKKGSALGSSSWSKVQEALRIRDRSETQSHGA